jgi:NAD(P)-dependent dehydrogenase (short-subunit alcohol dehydrogenase family)
MGGTVVVFGATGGLGRPVVAHLRTLGHPVVAVGHELDIRDEEAVAGFFAHAAEDLYAVVQLAGSFQGGRKLAETPASWYEDLFRLNVLGTAHVFRAAVPRLLARGEGRLVAIGAESAHRHTVGQSAYNAAKAALEALVLTLAEELKGTGVTANILLPTVIDTPGNRGREERGDPRWVAPDHLAALIGFLLSEAGSDLQGAAISVRGRL